MTGRVRVRMSSHCQPGTAGHILALPMGKGRARPRATRVGTAIVCVRVCPSQAWLAPCGLWRAGAPGLCSAHAQSNRARAAAGLTRPSPALPVLTHLTHPLPLLIPIRYVEAISHHFALTVELFWHWRWRLRLNGGGIYRHRL